MKKLILFILLLIVLIKKCFSATPDIKTFAPFGKVNIYKPIAKPTGLVLFLSGDGGWNKGVIDMAQQVANQGAMVAGIDIIDYIKALKTEKVKSYYPASDFEELSMSIQKTYHFDQYQKPILIGYSSGAVWVYGILAQAPANTFKGAISLGFCSDIDIDKPFYKGDGLESAVLKPGKSYNFLPTDKLTAPFIVLNGVGDKVCDFAGVSNFMKNLNKGELVSLTKVGHGFAVPANWQPQFIAAYQKLLKTPIYMEKKILENTIDAKAIEDETVKELPLIPIPSKINSNLPMAFLISGDGGWTTFDHELAQSLTEKGISVLGLDAQKYFWKEKTPAKSAQDFAKAIEFYQEKWHKKSFILVGYSFGADLSPFIAEAFPANTKQNLKGVFCLSNSEKADFEIHIMDMLSVSKKGDYNVANQISKIKAMKPVCFFGEEDDKDLVKLFKDKGAKIFVLPGGHRLNGDYEMIVQKILGEIKK